MSAFYVGNGMLSMLTDIIVRYNASGFNSFGFDLPDLSYLGTREDDVFDALRQMNVDALKARYDDYEEMIDDHGYETTHDIWQPRDINEVVKPWHYQLLKSLQCYIYQCSEGDIPDTKLYKDMDVMIQRLCKFIACRQKEYEEAKWSF